MARLRDTLFSDYATSPLVTDAVADLAAMGDAFKGPAPTAQTLFRGNTSGEDKGPYVSQFLMHLVPYGAQNVSHRMRTVTPNVDYLTD